MKQNNHNKSYNDKEFGFKWWVGTIGLSLLISGIIIFAVESYKDPRFASDLTNRIKTSLTSTPLINAVIPDIRGTKTILFMGLDSNGPRMDKFVGTRSDTMMLVKLNGKDHSVNIISVPRDSKVYIAEGHGVNKLNAAHALGGPDLAVKTVENMLDITIDHYLEVNKDGMKELVEAIGGVDLNVEKRLKYTDHTAKLYVDLEPGYQHLNPDQAEMYLRFRHDPEGDIGRIRRQQNFVNAVINKLSKPEIVTRVPQLVSFANKNVHTDMSLSELTALAGFATRVNKSNVQKAVIPGGPSSRGYISYWLIDGEGARQIVERLIYGYVENNVLPEDLTIAVAYTINNNDRMSSVVPLLESAGYKVICKVKTKASYNQIVAHTSKANFENARNINGIAGNIFTGSLLFSPYNQFCGSEDYTVILGEN